MPFPWLPISQLAGSLFSGIFNTVSNNQNNERNIAAQEQMNRDNIYFQQQTNELNRKWALEDWDRQNAYNSPVQQMARLKEAGLNPQLVYGSGAQTTAAMVRGTNAEAPKGQPSHSVPNTLPDFGSAIAQYIALTTAQVDLENKRAQTKLLQQQAEKNELDIIGKGIGNETGSFNLEWLRTNADANKEAIRLRNRQLGSSIANLDASTSGKVLEQQIVPIKLAMQQAHLKLAQAKNERDSRAAQVQYLRDLFDLQHLKPAQLEKIYAEIDNLHTSGKLKEFEYIQRSSGINPNDPGYVKALTALGYKLGNWLGFDMGPAPELNLSDIIKAAAGVKVKKRMPSTSEQIYGRKYIYPKD